MVDVRKKIQDSPDLSAAVDVLHRQNSLILATVNQEGKPHASYAPFAEYEGHMYVLLSGLSAHTQHLLHQQETDVMVIEDEATARNVFARARLNYTVTVEVVDKDSTRAAPILEALQNKLGKTVNVLSGLGDFMLFQLTPVRGRLVIGFGRAYVFEPNDIAHAIQLDDKNINTLG
ncbi:pyridoxamine 5'-phosphate oxidase family protein [Neisseriaceae bacterium ESL0693]|nr:pyridoxamine 5'-phosphate oxidase family protein [Neisseriaceae bacterium ESL0693]